MAYTSFKEISSRFWTAADCKVISSAIVEEGGGGHSRYTFKISYAYEFKGKAYVSDKVSSSYSGDGKYNKAQKLLGKFPAGSKARCQVNPYNPSEAVISHDNSIFLMLPFMLIPLIFVLIGAGGIYCTWTDTNINEYLKRKADRTRKAPAEYAVMLFFTAFLLIGLGVFYAIGIVPARKMLEAEKWNKIPCRIISGDVASHSDSDGTTYSINILYAYEINGTPYKSNRYSFMGGSSSGYDGKKKIVDSYPAGSSATCYVNPEDPSDTVLKRGFSAEMLFGLLPLIFAVVGAGGLYYTIKRRIASSGELGEYDDGRSFTDYASGDIVLKPVTGPFAAFAGSVLLCGFWNGIISIFVWQAALGWMKGRPEWFLSIFLIPFVLLGMFFLFLVATSFISLFNPRPKIIASTRTPHAGGKLRIQWQINEKSAELFKHLSIDLECRRGDRHDSRNRKNIIQKFTVADTSDYLRMALGSSDIEIPGNAIASNDCGDGASWLITLKGRLRNRPKIELEYPIRVIPRRR
ncbi:MAG: hypothetical protein A2X45_16585 [Lentisphaerae bacterium GWF2_50_93]|nr:MAG: hypothetical protein A2X45_16585 [Lentisphaerae bacterium GWF2_50_93]